MKVDLRWRGGGSVEGRDIWMGRWSDGRATLQPQLKAGARWAEATVTSGEKGGWLTAEGRRVWKSSFRKTRVLEAAADASERPQASESEENQS